MSEPCSAPRGWGGRSPTGLTTVSVALNCASHDHSSEGSQPESNWACRIEPHLLVDQRFETELADQGAGQGQSGVRNRVRAVEEQVEPVSIERRYANGKRLPALRVRRDSCREVWGEGVVPVAVPVVAGEW